MKMPPVFTDKNVTLPVWIVSLVLSVFGGWMVSSWLAMDGEATETKRILLEIDKKVDTGFADMGGKLDTTNSQLHDAVRRIQRNEDDIRELRKGVKGVQ